MKCKSGLRDKISKVDFGYCHAWGGTVMKSASCFWKFLEKEWYLQKNVIWLTRFSVCIAKGRSMAPFEWLFRNAFTWQQYCHRGAEDNLVNDKAPANKGFSRRLYYPRGLALIWGFPEARLYSLPPSPYFSFVADLRRACYFINRNKTPISMLWIDCPSTNSLKKFLKSLDNTQNMGYNSTVVTVGITHNWV